MATIPAATGDLYQVNVRYFQESQLEENVLHFIATTPSDDVELRLILILIDCFVNSFLPALPGNLTLDTVAWKRVAPTLSNEFITPFPASTVGTGTGLALPSYCSRLASIRTALGGRSHRGRIFFPGIPQEQAFNSQLNTGHAGWTAYLAFLQCLVTKFITGEPIGSNQFRIGVYSRKIGGSSFPFNTSGFTQAAQLSAVTLIATTRSRKIGHGN